MIKYAQKVEVSYTIDPGFLHFVTVKLILQPFVENALEHAWFGGTIHIRIIAEREGESVVFKVIDNGIGMSRETVRQILNPDGVRLGYGIRNVDERIKLQFGAEYGVEIASGRGIGTTVRIAIPVAEA
jgi:sensor histidine kinase YesM